MGSPPQVRGKLCRHGQTRRHDGITPAGAGKTRRCCAHRPKFQDHPRRCGENGLDRRRDPSGIGSPPQVRGKPKQTFRKPTRSRITPAGAGKTLSAGIGGFLRRDHPRRCGENEIADDIIRRCGGSPPQVRGKRVIPRIRWMYIRITPAGAGKTLRQLKVCGHAWDHPRRCGENSVFRSRAPNPSGSPPQVRGKLFNLLSIIRKNRITPAGAGKTFLP